MSEKPMTSLERLTFKAATIYLLMGAVLGIGIFMLVASYYEHRAGAVILAAHATKDSTLYTILLFLGAAQAAGTGMLLIALCPFLAQLGGSYERTTRDE